MESNSVDILSSEMTKLFVGGINDSLNEEEIKTYFQKFGEVKDLIIIKDKILGNNRGFGFIEFSDRNSAQKALDSQAHKIGERNVDVKRARPMGEKRQYRNPQYQYHCPPYQYQCPPYHYQYPPYHYQYPPYQYPMHHEYVNNGPNHNDANNLYNDENPTKSKKIFVGGLPSSITEADIRSYFQAFGNIINVVIMYDISTHRPRGFGFVTFGSSDVVDSVLKQKCHELCSKKVHVKVAIPKDNDLRNNSIDHYNPKSNGGSAFGFYPGCRPPVAPFYYGVSPYGGVGLRGPSVRSPYGPHGFGGALVYPNYYSSGYSAMYTADSTYDSKGAEDAASEKLDVKQES